MSASRLNRLAGAVGAAKVVLLGPAERPGSPLLVVSPHPDDDVIGLGGMIALESDRGRPVWSLVVTDGRGSVRPPDMQPADLVRVRRGEAEEALRIAGAEGVVFLDARSDDLLGAIPATLRRATAAILSALEPAEICTTSPFEKHATHVNATRLLLQALRSRTDAKPALYGYGVWEPFIGENPRAVDISSVVERKRRAIQAHKSQCAYKAYDEGILAKNRYDAVFLETHGAETIRHAELLLDMSELCRNPGLSLRAFATRAAQAMIERRIASE